MSEGAKEHPDHDSGNDRKLPCLSFLGGAGGGVVFHHQSSTFLQ